MTELRAQLQEAIVRADEKAKAAVASSESIRQATKVAQEGSTIREALRQKMERSDLVSSPSAESTGALLLTETCYSNSVA
jgi:hypothetical protein